MANDDLSPLIDAAQDASAIVYILTNPAMPGYVKIGKTKNLAQRLSQLNSSSVPEPFVCEHAGLVQEAGRVEYVLHVLFAEHRCGIDREFFRMDASLAVEALRLMQHKDVTTTVAPTVRPHKEPTSTARHRAFAPAHLCPVQVTSDATRIEAVLRKRGGSAYSQNDLAHTLGVSKGEVSKMLRNCPNVERIRVDNRYVIRIKDAV